MENFLSEFREKLKVPRNLAIFTGVIGLILGLILAWGVFPVKWKDASAEHLRADERVVYLRNAINAYTMTGRVQEAQLAWASLGSNAVKTLEDLNQSPGFLYTEQIERYAQAVDTSAPAPIVLPEDNNAVVKDDGTIIGLRPADETEEPEKKEKGLLWLGIILLVLLLVGAGLVWWFFFKDKNVELPFKLKKRNEEKPSPTFGGLRPAATPIKREPIQKPVKEVDETEKPEEEAKPSLPNLASLFGLSDRQKNSGEAAEPLPAAKPVAQFMTTYMLGDDMYDESFTFDAPNGEFLGECGVSSSDTIGVGEPKKVSAFDIWLFDKNDIQTVTKVVMSKHAFNDAATRQRLEIRGEPIMADDGKQFVLETATLRLEAKLVSFQYGDLPLPDDSYFQRATMELAIYRK
jgi:flagellar basal body-associated protein FliL